MDNSIIYTKAKSFAIRIVRLYKHLSESGGELILAKQILRSGTSIGANIAEAKYAQSKSDFYSKYKIALKEASETLYWLELLKSADYINDVQYNSLFNDCDELTSMLVKATKTIDERRG